MYSSASGNDKGQARSQRKVLSRLGHNVIWATSPNIGENLEQGHVPEPGFASGTPLKNVLWYLDQAPDIFLYLEPLGLIPEGLENAPFPTACIISDFHNQLKPRQILAHFFDHVFVYHRNYLEVVTEHPQGNVHWWPYSCDLDVFHPLPVERDLDVAFVGQLITDERRRVTAEIARHWKLNEQRYYKQDEIPEVYSRAKIVINLPLKDDLNFRFFEAMSCGALLLTRRVANGQELLFEEAVHYAAFETETELFDKIDYYLSHESERATIAAAGLAEIQANHRLEQRLTQLLDIVQNNPEPAAPIRSMQPHEVDLHYALLYEYWRKIDAIAYLVQRARRANRRWYHLMFPAARAFLRGTLR